MRAVIDTNVFLSGLLWHGVTHELLVRVRDSALGFVSSPALLAEMGNATSRPKFESILTRAYILRDRAIAEIRKLAEVIDPPPLPEPVCRYSDDDSVLTLALAARVDMIVSGDADLLAIGMFQGIPVLTPAQALERISGG